MSLYASSAYIVDMILYHYEINPNSITTSGNNIRLLDRLKVETVLVDTYKKRNVPDIFKPTIVNEFINRFYINTLYLLFTRFEKCPNVYATMHEVIYDYFPDWENHLNIAAQDKPVQFLLNILKLKSVLSDIELEEVRKKFLEMQKMSQEQS